MGGPYPADDGGGAWADGRVLPRRLGRRTRLQVGSAASIRCRIAPDRSCRGPISPNRRGEASSHHPGWGQAPSKDTAVLRPNAARDRLDHQSAKGLDGTYDGLDGPPSDLDPLARAGLDEPSGDAAAWLCSGTRSGYHEEWTILYGEWMRDDAVGPAAVPVVGPAAAANAANAAKHIRVAVGSDRPDASPVVSSRHCSLFLIGSCPPACLRSMGSARANRSGWEPDSVSRELV